MKTWNDLCHELEIEYQARNFNKETLVRANYLVSAAYLDLHSQGVEDFSVQQLKGLSSVIEILDYFNKFDESLGVEVNTEEIKKGNIYRWLINLGGLLWSEINFTGLPNHTAEIELFLEKARFTAASVFNEMYRLNNPICVDEIQNQIHEVEKLAQRLQERGDVKNIYIRYIDNLSYHYFLYGKVCRQFKHYVSAEQAFEKSITYLMELAKIYSEAEIEDYGKPHFQSMMMRVGVVHLAQSSMYLSWGKINKSYHYVSAALKLIGSNDLATTRDAHAIKGAILRIKAGSDKSSLKDSVKLLEGSYNFFTSEQIMPRRAIRNLMALETALIIQGNLDKAIKLLGNLFTNELNNSKHKEFTKLLRNVHWVAQIHTLISRIARKDKKDIYFGDLRILAEKLLYYSGQEKPFSSKAFPKWVDSSINLAVFEAQKAINKAPTGTRIEFDAWWALGEAQLKLKKYDDAKKCYRKVYDLCVSKTEKDTLATDKITPLVAGCCLYLAKIAIRQKLFNEVKEQMAEFDKLGEIEHEWINELAREVQADYKTVTSKQIIIEFDIDDKEWDMDQFESELKKQIAIKFNVKNMSLKDFNQRFHRGKNVYYELKKMVSSNYP